MNIKLRSTRSQSCPLISITHSDFPKGLQPFDLNFIYSICQFAIFLCRRNKLICNTSKFVRFIFLFLFLLYRSKEGKLFNVHTIFFSISLIIWIIHIKCKFNWYFFLHLIAFLAICNADVSKKKKKSIPSVLRLTSS